MYKFEMGKAFVEDLKTIADDLSMKVSGGSDSHTEAEIDDIGKYGVNSISSLWRGR